MGGDTSNEASYISVIKQEFDPNEICGIDIREDSKADVIMNYLTCEKATIVEPDIIISNPPFYLAEEFILKSLELVSDGGYVIMLLRLNFFGSVKRKELFENYMPMSCFIHHKRINFIPQSMKNEMREKGLKPPSGDSIEYAHFEWRKDINPEFCKTYII